MLEICGGADWQSACEGFFTENYYPLMCATIEHCATPELQLRVDPSVGASEAELERRKQLLSKLTQDDVHRAEEAVQQHWDTKWKSFSLYVQSIAPVKAPTEYWANEFYPILHDMFDNVRMEEVESQLAPTAPFDEDKENQMRPTGSRRSTDVATPKRKKQEVSDPSSSHQEALTPRKIPKTGGTFPSTADLEFGMSSLFNRGLQTPIENQPAED